MLKKVGTVSVDGTKLKANASKHSGMSHGHAVKVLEQLEYEVKELTARAEEWNLVCCSYHLKRLFSLLGSPSLSFGAPEGRKTA